MHKHVGILVTVATIIALSIIPAAADKLFTLLFVGLVPFTNYVIPPSAMLIIYAALLALGIYAFARLLVTASSPVKRDIQSRQRARKKVLRHTVVASKKQTPRTKKHFSHATEHQAS
jgi:ABC-type Na+ efflux pump permease subunit